ncbi:MAG: hypothetical protein A3C55_04705 [Gammaproteobacteria bacterium RIFCSPHIGHO2_02_FULL_42_13]|nr:MAG: hypothetical protein A3C55_04705 [Gammaproteobacteria bacterium RIFCSPHIGHO2_02_FULL_42_13]OGT69677.1 MAG: hypothetical protein A3H43_02050 [Gammaproteobacteria bacterium RIFCSPLOWO2_02_FULL_42_9]
MRLRQILLLSLISVLLTACSSTKPYENYSGNNAIFQGVADQQPTLYLMQNKSKQTIFLDIPIHTGASAGFGSTLKPNHWSALMVGYKNIIFSCTPWPNPTAKTIPCNQVLHILRTIPNADGAPKGAYWAAENRQYDQLITAINKRKIYLYQR